MAILINGVVTAKYKMLVTFIVPKTHRIVQCGYLACFGVGSHRPLRIERTEYGNFSPTDYFAYPIGRFERLIMHVSHLTHAYSSRNLKKCNQSYKIAVLGSIQSIQPKKNKSLPRRIRRCASGNS
jgi:hypothetical protein